MQLWTQDNLVTEIPGASWTSILSASSAPGPPPPPYCLQPGGLLKAIPFADWRGKAGKAELASPAVPGWRPKAEKQMVNTEGNWGQARETVFPLCPATGQGGMLGAGQQQDSLQTPQPQLCLQQHGVGVAAELRLSRGLASSGNGSATSLMSKTGAHLKTPLLLSKKHQPPAPAEATTSRATFS